MIITVLSTKGGSGKTTTAMHLAAALSSYGDVTVVDTDRQGSAMSWAGGNGVELSFDVIALPKLEPKNFERMSKRTDHIIIDCPPHNINTISKAIRVADHIIVTAQPTPADLDKVFEAEELALEWQEPDTGLPSLTVLLTRVIKRTNARLEARSVLETNGLDLFDTEIHQRQGTAISHGTNLGADNVGEGYEELLAELIAKHKELTGEQI